jgi:transposase
MLPLNLKLSKQQMENLQAALKHAQILGDISKANRIMSLLMLSTGHSIEEITKILMVTAQAIRAWLKKYILEGIRGLRSGKSPGRPSRLTKSQRKELKKMIEDGPEESGFVGSCWRSPMIQSLVYDHFGVSYNIHYLSELLNNMGLSYQKAKFFADKRDEKVREKWLKEEWPEILNLAKEKTAYILFGDEASFPQWGTLSYTWAPKGKQPIVKTSGSRKGYKIFGLIDYYTGKFFSKGHEGKLNAESYMEFLQDVLSKTRKHIILIQDGASYHTSRKMKDFFKKHEERITVYQLPSYSPDYNPIEKLWKKIKTQGTHLKYFPTFESLKDKINEMLGIFEYARNEVLSLFGFYDNLEIAY